MSIFPFVLFLVFWFHTLDGKFSASLSHNALNGQHLRIIWPRWEGNPKGLSGPLMGGLIIDYLKTRFNFTYEMVRVTENRLEPQGKERGLFSYLFDNQSDLIVSGIVPTIQRNQFIDQSTPWDYAKLALLIPVQDETANIKAVVKPFQWPVWIGLIISVLSVVAVLNLMQRYLEYRSQSERNSRGNNEILGNQQDNNQRRLVPKSRLTREFFYVFGNLLSQGGPCPSKRLPIRLVAGVWALAAFIFVQAYTSTLITYVIAPVNPPLIHSVYDIAESNDINLLVKLSGTPERLLMNNNWTGFYEKIRDRIKSFPQSRCTLVSECIDLVKPGTRNVFMDAEAYQMDAIRENFEKTGKCNLQIARDAYLSVSAVMALQKKSPYTDSISQGLLELRQAGLIEYWEKKFRPMPPQCRGKIESGSKTPDKDKLSRLSLKNLTGAFLVLSIGLSLSLLAFLCEKIVSMPRRINKESNKKKIPRKSIDESSQIADQDAPVSMN